MIILLGESLSGEIFVTFAWKSFARLVQQSTLEQFFLYNCSHYFLLIFTYCWEPCEGHCLFQYFSTSVCTYEIVNNVLSDFFSLWSSICSHSVGDFLKPHKFSSTVISLLDGDFFKHILPESEMWNYFCRENHVSFERICERCTFLCVHKYRRESM